jgi:hypothetical protein
MIDLVLTPSTQQTSNLVLGVAEEYTYPDATNTNFSFLGEVPMNYRQLTIFKFGYPFCFNRRLKVWDGTEMVPTTFIKWDGTKWATVRVKQWDGTKWIRV